MPNKLHKSEQTFLSGGTYINTSVNRQDFVFPSWFIVRKYNTVYIDLNRVTIIQRYILSESQVYLLNTLEN